MSNKISVYLPDDVLNVLDAKRSIRRPIPSLSAIINEMIWDGLPTDTKLELRRKRSDKKRLNDD